MKKFIIAALGVALGVASLNASALGSNNAAGTLAVSLDVTTSCTITTGGASTATFASVVAGATAQVSQTANITVTCTGVDHYYLGAGNGTVSPTAGTRYLGVGGTNIATPTAANSIPYTLGIAGSGTFTGVTGDVWGDTLAAAQTAGMSTTTAAGLVAGTQSTPNVTGDTYTITVKATPAATVLAGTYIDTVALKLAW
jgi:spore coat protein U-like protein